PVLRFWNRNRNRYAFINCADEAGDTTGDNAWLGMNGAAYPLQDVPGNPSGYSRMVLRPGYGSAEIVRSADQSLVGGRIQWTTTSARIASSNTSVSANNDSVWFSAGNASFSAGTGGATQFSGTDHRFFVNGGSLELVGRTQSGGSYGKWLKYHQPSVHNNSPYLEGANQGVGIVFGNRHLYVADNVGNHRPLTCSTLTQSSGRDQKTDLQH